MRYKKYCDNIYAELINEKKGGYYNNIVISDKYAVIKEIAVTKHTSIFLVRHIQLDALRIAKVVSKQIPDYSRVHKEAMLIKDLKYDGLPIIYDIEEDDISICIIEEYIAGKSLEKYIQECASLSMEQITDISVSVCNIIEYLHKEAKIVHLDIKPQNIIVQEKQIHRKKRLVVHLIDFDSSRRSDDDTGGFYGTLGYAAPEQFFGKGSFSSDIYSIGILIAYMASDGHLQSFMDDTCSVYHLSSKPIGTVIEKCLRHNQNQRYQSIDQLKSELEAIRDKKLFNNISARNKEQEIIDIYVSGTRHGAGTTHFCLCMASFLAKRRKTVIVIRHGDCNDLKSEKILRYLKNGVAVKCGVVIRPEYSGCVDDEHTTFSYRIHDMGTDRGQHAGRMNILIGDCGYRRNDYNIMEKSQEDTIIFINHISGDDFYRFCRTYTGNQKLYRFPCVYDWHKGSRLFEEAMFEVFGLSEKNTWSERKKAVKDMCSRLMYRCRHNTSWNYAGKSLCECIWTKDRTGRM